MKKKVIAFLMAVFLVISSVPISAEAAEPSGTDNLIDIDETNFPDPVFREYLRNTYDTDNDGKINPDEVTEIYIDGSNVDLEENGEQVKSLKGNELFPNLTELYCIDSQLMSLDVSKNLKLMILYCGINDLTSLDVSKNSNLTTLSCGENPLMSLDVSKNPNLEYLECSYNQLTSLDVSKNPNLKYLYCEHNQLSKLDVSKNPKLMLLDCSNNQLTSLDVTQNPNLESMSCGFNHISSLDVSKNSKLAALECNYNQLTSLDVTQNPNLWEWLNCSGNQLSSLDVGKNPKLTELFCDSNQLTSLDVSHNPYLRQLNCEYNQLASLDLSNNKELYTLSCDCNFNEVILPKAGKKFHNLRLYHSEGIVNLSEIKGIDFSVVKDSRFDKSTNTINVKELKYDYETDDYYVYEWTGETSGLPFDTKFFLDKSPQPVPSVNVSYRTHVQSIGWQSYVSNGTMAGTSGQAKRLEGININVAGNSNLGIQYTTHVQSYGWLPWSSNDDMSGTEGEAKRLEAIKIQLTGADRYKYDVYYRVHAQSYGWLGWAKNGAPAGTAGYAKRLEGIQILVVKKGEKIDQNQGGISSARSEAYIALAGSSPVVGSSATSNTDPIIGGAANPNVSYRTHVQSFGWQGWKYNGQMSGTSGQAKRLEGINIKLTNKPYSGGICYTTHVQSYGWQGDINNSATWKKDGEMSGTSGQAKRLEAIMIKLTGEMADHYDVYYRVHAQSYGWLGWAKNGDPAGTAGYAKRLEGIQIVLVPKGGAAPVNNYGGINSANGQAYIAK